MKVQSWKCNVRECLYVRGKRGGIQGKMGFRGDRRNQEGEEAYHIWRLCSTRPNKSSPRGMRHTTCG